MNEVELPKSPGTCFDEFILLDAPDRDISEIVMATGVWPARPDVKFHISIIDNGPTLDRPLLTRLRMYRSVTGRGVLRARERKVGELQGEEFLERVREEDGAEGHLFIWEAQGLPDRWDRPQTRLSMSTGNGAEAKGWSSLSDEDALRLWDRFVDSWRWRPGASDGRIPAP